MRGTRALTVLVAAALLVGYQAAPAAAAPPSNDTFAGATAASLGFSQQLDTTEATTDADDAQLNTDCGISATDASVWYAFTAAADARVVVDASRSDYDASVLVGVGTQGNLQLVSCGNQGTAFDATAGRTYYVLVIDDQFDGGGNGGMLRISFGAGPTVEVSVDPVGRVDPQTGVATLTGTYTCTNADYLVIAGNIEQTVGRWFVSVGSFIFSPDYEVTCDGRSHSWSATVEPENYERDRFFAGKATTFADADACGAFDCAYDSVQQSVRLRGGSR